MVGSNPWTLDYTGVSLAMNANTSIYFLEAPDIGAPETRSDDAEMPRDDGDDFGQDFKSGRTITLSIGLMANSEQAVLDLESTFSRAWDAERVRSTTRSLASLTAANAGRTRVFYGRPRRYAANFAYQQQGVVTVTCDFKTRDHFAYGDESVVTVPLIPGQTGGFTAPVTAPITMTAPSQRAAGLVIGGDRAAWLRMKIKAGIQALLNPTVQITNRWSLKLNTTIPAGQSVELDARPWRRTVLLSSGGSYAGYLDRASRLALAKLDPGTYEAVLRGTDSSGTASLEIRWQTSFASLGIVS